MTNILEKNFLVDTNILVYLLDKESPLFSRVNQLFELAEKAKLRVFVPHQVLLELVRTLIRDYNLSLSKSTKMTQKLVDKDPFEVIYPLPTTISRFYKIAESYPKVQVFDLYLAATAIDNGVDAIITNNEKDFQGIKGLEVFGLEDIKKLL